MRMTFDDYDAALKEMSALPDPKLSGEYGITEKDVEKMGEDPEKFVPFLMYLSTRSWYKDPAKGEDVSFLNADALSCTEASEAIENLLYDAVELYESENEH